MHRAHGSFRDHRVLPVPVPVPPRNVVPQTSAYSNPPTQEDWVRIQGIIHQYYVLQNQPLHSVRESLRKEHGFKASERMIKARLAKWEYIKNAKREDWGYLAVLHEIRRKENKPTVFLIRGHRKTVKDLQRFIRNQNVSPEKFLKESFDNFRAKGERVPEYIRACTPGPEDALYSPSADATLSEIRSPSPLVNENFEPLLQRSDAASVASPDDNSPDVEPSRSAHSLYEHECPYKNYATESNRFSMTKKKLPHMPATSPMERRSQEHLHIYSSEQTRLELEACSHQLLKPIPLMAKYGNNDMRCWMMIQHNGTSDDDSTADFTAESWCSACDLPNDKHFPSLDLFEPQQGQRSILNGAASQSLHLPTSTRVEGSWVWISYCFLACMSLSRGDENYGNSALKLAGEKFEKLLKARDPLLLTAAGLMITVLHLHCQSSTAVRVLQSAKNVVEKNLAATDPIRITISYLAVTADSSQDLEKTNFSSALLKQVYDQLKSTHSAEHPYVIAARHNYAWVLKYEGKRDEAENEARETYRDSLACFGALHMQSITSLSAIAGCLLDIEGRERECIECYRTMVSDATQILGVIHPYTLEAQRRLAHCFERIPGKVNVAIKLHRTILFGRATMLGREHIYTTGQKDHYLKLLQENGKWEDGEGRPSRERRELDDLFRKDPEEAWELVSRQDDADHEMTDAPSLNGIVRSHAIDHSSRDIEDSSQEEEWSALGWQIATDRMARSRSTSPTSTNEHEAY